MLTNWNNNRNTSLLYLAILFLLFPIIYYKVFSAHFLSWDDAEYILKNKDVHEFNIKNFFTSYYLGNYQPLTMVSYAIDWLCFGKTSTLYHLENLTWHFLNSLLVFALSNKLLKHDVKAFIVTIIFAFHPMQIETVGWIAERKNVLMAFFFLSSILMYINYIERKTRSYLIAASVFFIVSLLCKVNAVLLPLVFVLLDYFYQQPVNKKTVIHKIVLLLVAVLFGAINLLSQQEGGYLNESHSFYLHEQIGFAGFAMLQYVYRFLVPFNLSVIYPYPPNKITSLLVGYISIVVVVFVLYKLVKNKNKQLFFGLLFFIINIVLVLQIIPFGEALTADRYMYIAIIGLALFLVSVFSFKQNHYYIICAVFILLLGVLSFARCQVWNNSISLYQDILKNYPHSAAALNSMGAEYMQNKNYKKAIYYFNGAINENPRYYKAFYNKALLEAQTNNYNQALINLNTCLDLNAYNKAYLARANVYYNQKELSKAQADANRVLIKEPNNAKVLFVLANCYDDANEIEKALVLYTRAINIDSEEAEFYFRRAIVFGKKQNFSSCLNDLNQSISLNSSNAEAFYWRGVAKVNLKQNPCSDFNKSVSLGFLHAQNAFYRYCQ